MNCPTCGAENEAGAQFCVECGSALENNDIEATIAGQQWNIEPEPVDPEADKSDKTPAPDAPEDEAEEAMTVITDRASMYAESPDVSAQPAAESAAPTPAEDRPPPPESLETPTPSVEPPPSVEMAAGAEDGGSRKKFYIVGGIVLVIVLLCCCCLAAVAGIGASTPDLFEDILRELSEYSVEWPVA